MCISHFMFFCQWFITWCLFYIYLYYRNDVRQEANSTDFLIRVQNGSQTCNINNAFGPGTANDHAAQQWLKKFCKGDESLEDEVHSSQQLEVDHNQLRASSMPILLKLHKKLPKNSTPTILWLTGIWNKQERWKNSCLMSWPNMKKNHLSEMLSSLILHNNDEPFLNRTLMCDKKVDFIQ